MTTETVHDDDDDDDAENADDVADDDGDDDVLCRFSIFRRQREKGGKKGTKYFNISLLSSEVYFDVHYDYTTSRHHLWYKSGLVLLQNYFEKKKT